MIAPIFENIVILVLNAPTCPSSTTAIKNDLRGERMVGNPTIVIEELSIGFAVDFYFTPVNQQSRLLLSQGNLIEITTLPNLKILSIPTSVSSSFDFPIGF